MHTANDPDWTIEFHMLPWTQSREIPDHTHSGVIAEHHLVWPKDKTTTKHCSVSLSEKLILSFLPLFYLFIFISVWNHIQFLSLFGLFYLAKSLNLSILSNGKIEYFSGRNIPLNISTTQLLFFYLIKRKLVVFILIILLACFWYTLSSTKGLLLTLCSGITPVVFGKFYGILGIKLRMILCEANCLYTVLLPKLSFNIWPIVSNAPWNIGLKYV